MHFQNSASGTISLFQPVNAFIGQHVECTDLGVDVRYHVELCSETGRCIVVARCACGASASFAVQNEYGQALMMVTRRLAIPATEDHVAARHA